MTMDQAVEAVIAANLEAEAFVAGERHITYAEFGAGLNAVAGGLAALSVGKGDRVATILPNSPEYIYFFFGAGKTGAVHVPISPLLRENEIAHILAESEAKVVVMVPSAWNNDLLGIVQRLAPTLPHLEKIVLWSDSVPEGMTGFDDFMAAGRANPIESVSKPEDLYGLIYTSGTTGAPKAVMHSHRTMLAVPILLQRADRAKKPLGETFKMIRTVAKHRERYGKWGREQVTFLTPMPFQALAGYQSMMSTILNGRRLVIIERFHPVLVMRLIQEHHINSVAVTPTMGRLMLDVPDFDSYDTSSLLTFAFGAALTPPELAEEASEKFNCPVVIGFGATETGGAAALTKFYDSGANALDSVGRPLPGVEVRLVDENGRTVADGEVGEVVVRTEGNMLGYYNRPEETSEILDADGFLHLGDLAIRDKRGYVKIVGRKKDVIIRGGQNIYPGEVEGVMEQHEQVQQAAVVGVPDATGGEAVWAFVVREAGSELTASQLVAWCGERIAPYKLPTQVRFVDELPLTTTGKVRKPTLREMALAET
jgi:acyl-CoA synthetase (AMP-forming)/AMP-acid ligase II